VAKAVKPNFGMSLREFLKPSDPEKVNRLFAATALEAIAERIRQGDLRAPVKIKWTGETIEMTGSVNVEKPADFIEFKVSSQGKLVVVNAENQQAVVAANQIATRMTEPSKEKKK
jgi:hypothetical protein